MTAVSLKYDFGQISFILFRKINNAQKLFSLLTFW